MRQEAKLAGKSVLASRERRLPAENKVLAAQLRADAVRLLSRAEADKSEMARAIHDQLGQALTAMSLELSVWKTELATNRSNSANDILKKVAALSSQLGGAIDCTRTVSSKLWSRVLEEFGLSAAIESQLKKIGKRTGVVGLFSADPVAQQLRIDPLLAAQIFRLAEEVIEWRAHSDCKCLRVCLLVQDDKLQLLFEDDGTAGRLLAEIGARVRLLGGELQLKEGAQSIRITLPLQVLK